MATAWLITPSQRPNVRPPLARPTRDADDVASAAADRTAPRHRPDRPRDQPADAGMRIDLQLTIIFIMASGVIVIFQGVETVPCQA